MQDGIQSTHIYTLLISPCSVRLPSSGPALFDLFSGHTCAQQHIPVNEEWLREVGLDADDLTMMMSTSVFSVTGTTNLVVYIVVISSIPTYPLQGIEGQAISAMIIDSFERREHKKERGLSDSHKRQCL